MSSYAPLIELLERAVASPAGLRIQTGDADALRRRFYVAKRVDRETTNKDRFDGLHFRINPDSGRVLEIHKKKPDKTGGPAGTAEGSAQRDIEEAIPGAE
jgi:hypothetical protein